MDLPNYRIFRPDRFVVRQPYTRRAPAFDDHLHDISAGAEFSSMRLQASHQRINESSAASDRYARRISVYEAGHSEEHHACSLLLWSHEQFIGKFQHVDHDLLVLEPLASDIEKALL